MATPRLDPCVKAARKAEYLRNRTLYKGVKRLMLHLDAEMRERIERDAARDGVSLSEKTREFIQWGMDSYDDALGE